MKDFKVQVTSKLDNSDRDASMVGEISLGELSKGVSYVEMRRAVDHFGDSLFTKVQIDQSFEGYRYLQKDLGMIWVSQS